MTAAEDARYGAQNLPLWERVCIAGEKDLACALRLCAMEPAAEEAEMIGEDLAAGFCFCGLGSEFAKSLLQTLFQDIARDGLHRCASSAFGSERNGFNCRRLEIERGRS